MSSEIDDGNKRDIMVEHIADARRLGVEVLPPNINEGEADFTVKDGKIVFGLTGDQGPRPRRRRGDRRGPQRRRAVQGLLRLLRAHRPPDRPEGGASRRLIKAGAFDCIGASRRAAAGRAARAVQPAERAQDDRARGQRSLFEALDGEADGGRRDARPRRACPTCPSGRRARS